VSKNPQVPVSLWVLVGVWVVTSTYKCTHNTYKCTHKYLVSQAGCMVVLAYYCTTLPIRYPSHPNSCLHSLLIPGWGLSSASLRSLPLPLWVCSHERFVGESARLRVPASDTVRESGETALGAVCDGVNCRSSPSSSAAWSVVSVSSALAMWASSEPPTVQWTQCPDLV
jgi:hypothetical protein